MNEPADRELHLGQDAQAALDELMDEYAGQLIKDAVARKSTQQGHIEVTAGDLRATASGRLGLLTILRLVLAAGLTLVVASAAAIAAALLPEAVDDTTARVWIGIGLFAWLVTALAGIGVYVVRHLGEETVWRWLSPDRMDRP